jgi:heat shock protein HslJ
MSLRRFAAVLALLAVVTGCTSGPGAGGILAGTEWVLESYLVDGNLTIVPDGQFADAHFDVVRLQGFSGCNSFQGTYVSAGRTIRIEPGPSTLMACEGDAGTLETTYRTLLGEATFYTARRDTLTMFDSAGQTLLVFDQAPRNPLLGNWVVGSFVTGSTMAEPIKGTLLTAVFGIGSVGGSAGCNTYSGAYGTNGSRVRIGRLATTQIACDQDVMDQETAFLTAMDAVGRLESRGDTMILNDLRGTTLVILVRPSLLAGASGAPSGEPTATPTAKPTATEEPTAAPTEAPTTAPTAAPTAAPSVIASRPPAPTLSLPPSVPPTATCDVVDGTTTLATLSHPATWSTVTEPPELACRYFDPAPITVPPDPTTLTAAVTVTTEATAFDAAFTAATDATAWTVIRQAPLTIASHRAAVVEATALADGAGITKGQTRLAYLIELNETTTMTIQTVGDATSDSYASNGAVTTLMAASATFPAP